MRYKNSLAAFGFLIFATAFCFGAETDIYGNAPETVGDGGEIISRYLQATQADSLKTNSDHNSIQLDIDASVPRLKQHGRLRALRKMSAVGKITYRVLGFQGDNTVKNQVIARYLQAEQQGQDRKLTITPANYKFKLKGAKMADGNKVFVFLVAPREKRVGLFKGELWLDSKTYLPVVEKGRLVKNPTIFFRKVEFERDFTIQNGISVPERLSSTISTRLVGTVNLNVAYSSPMTDDSEAEIETVSENSTSSFNQLQ